MHSSDHSCVYFPLHRSQNWFALPKLLGTRSGVSLPLIPLF